MRHCKRTQRCGRKKATSNNSATTKCLLCCCLALFLDVFHASAGAVVIMIQLVQSSKVTTVARREGISIGDIVFDSDKLFSIVSSAHILYGRLFSSVIADRRALNTHYVVVFVANAPTQWPCRCLALLIITRHSNFIEKCDAQGPLWETVRRHEALVTAL